MIAAYRRLPKVGEIMKLKNAFTIFLLSAPLAAVLRIFQRVTMFDPLTGFYLNRYRTSGLIITILLALLTVALIVICRTAAVWPERIPVRSRLLAFMSLIMAVGMGYQVITAMAGCTPGTLTPAVFTAWTAIVALLSLGSLAFFLHSAAAYYRGGKVSGALSVFPLLMILAQLCQAFMSFTGIASLSEYSYDIIMYCLLCLFWLFHGRILSGSGFARAMKWIFGVGFAGAVFCLITVLPRYYLDITGRQSYIHVAPNPVFLITAVYIAVFLFETLNTLPKKEGKKYGQKDLMDGMFDQ